jgi:alpha-beta hydrolase superfamily lysophospholipase
MRTARGPVAAVALATCVLVAAADLAWAQGRAVVFPASDGVPIAARLYESAVSPAPAVVLVHMLARSKDDWHAVAETLQRDGITALAIDLRGHGASGGSADNLRAMVQDVRAAVTWLRMRPEVRPGAIGLAGASLGANLALIVAAEQETVRAAALLSPSTDYRGVSLSGVVRRYGARPLLLVASTEDPLALRTLKELSADAQGVREQHLEPALAHGTALLEHAPGLGRTLVDWFRRTLLF